jgi:hypothetical protein
VAALPKLSIVCDYEQGGRSNCTGQTFVPEAMVVDTAEEKRYCIV